MPLTLPTSARLRELAGPLVADAIRAFGSIATLYVATPTVDAANRTTHAWTVLKAGVRCRLVVDAVEELRTVFGADTVATVAGQYSVLTGRSGVGPVLDLAAHDYALVVTSGFLAGSAYLVAGAAPDDIAARQRLGLVRTTEAVP